MGQLYLVRHGQASLGAEDYDQLSPLGHSQCVRLGEHWKTQGVRFAAVLRGSLKRHEQTLEGIGQGLGEMPEPLVWPGLNEYDSEAVIRTVHHGPLVKPTTPEGYRQHFRLLRDGLTQWMNGVVSPQGMPGYDAFVEGVTSALNHVRQHCSGDVLLVSSGGPIATAVGQVLRLAPETTIELNLRIRNSAVSEFSFTPKRHSLVSFNTVAHLDTPSHREWITYA